MALSLAAVMAVSLAACGGSSAGESGSGENSGGNSGGNTDASGASGSSGDEKVELKFSWWGGDARHQAMLNAIELYQEKNPNVVVEGEYQGFKVSACVGTAAGEGKKTDYDRLFQEADKALMEAKKGGPGQHRTSRIC